MKRLNPVMTAVSSSAVPMSFSNDVHGCVTDNGKSFELCSSSSWDYSFVDRALHSWYSPSASHDSLSTSWWNTNSQSLPFASQSHQQMALVATGYAYN